MLGYDGKLTGTKPQQKELSGNHVHFSWTYYISQMENLRFLTLWEWLSSSICNFWNDRSLPIPLEFLHEYIIYTPLIHMFSKNDNRTLARNLTTQTFNPSNGSNRNKIWSKGKTGAWIYFLKHRVQIKLSHELYFVRYKQRSRRTA